MKTNNLIYVALRNFSVHVRSDVTNGLKFAVDLYGIKQFDPSEREIEGLASWYERNGGSLVWDGENDEYFLPNK